ncbi:MAG: MATE family efflux transporter [Dehalococcoidia bacterium]|nr:MATE family efflux transporter [Dehalococcoidia bacterium]
MGRESISKLLFRFSGPAIAAMLVSSSYNVIDAIFIGRLGTESLAAVTAAFPMMMIFMAISVGTGVGAASLIARHLGARRRDEADRVVCNTITLTVITGLIVTAVFLPNTRFLLSLFGASGNNLPIAESYVTILIIFVVITFSSVVMENLIRAEGNPSFSGTVMIISAVTNIILDPIFIFGLGPIPAMGVSGAAAATVVGRSVGVIVFLGYLLSGKTSYRLRRSYFMLRMCILVEIYRVGVASIVRIIAGSVSLILANRVAASFGVIPLAALGVVFRISSFAFMPCVGVAQGMMPIVGYNFGAEQTRRVGEVVIKAGVVAFAWSLFCWAVVTIFPVQVVSLFNSDPQFLGEGIGVLRIFSIGYFVVGIQIILTSFFQGIGKGVASLVLSSSRQVIFLLPAVLIFPMWFGLNGLWAAFPFADIAAVILTLVWAGIQFKRMGIQFRLRFNQQDAG